jgi:hypothetical protein
MKKLAIVILCLTGCLQYAYAQSGYEKAVFIKGVRWRTPAISVCWDNPDASTAADRDIVRRAITNTWQRYSALTFTKWDTDKAADIHIYVQDIQPEVATIGEPIRNKLRGITLNFSFKKWCPDCKKKRNFYIAAMAVHEFGHALGFAHEQIRTECDFSCSDDVVDKHKGTSDWVLPACDRQSVMNSCNEDYCNNGFLSNLDIQALQKWYGRPLSSDKSMLALSKQSYTSPEPAVNSSWLNVVQKDRRLTLRRSQIYMSRVTNLLEHIAEVRYHLGPTFNNRTLVSRDWQNNFGIEITHAKNLTITYDVVYKKLLKGTFPKPMPPQPIVLTVPKRG